MWKEVPRTRKKEVLSSHHVESSRPSLMTVSLEVQLLNAKPRPCHPLICGIAALFCGFAYHFEAFANWQTACPEKRYTEHGYSAELGVIFSFRILRQSPRVE